MTTLDAQKQASIFDGKLDDIPTPGGDDIASRDSYALRLRAGRLLRVFREAGEERAELEADKGLTLQGRRDRFAPTLEKVKKQFDEVGLEQTQTVLNEHLPKQWDELFGSLWPDEPGAISRTNRELDCLTRMSKDDLSFAVTTRNTNVLRLLAMLPKIERDLVTKGLSMPQSAPTINEALRIGASHASPQAEARCRQLEAAEECARSSATMLAQLSAKVGSGKVGDEGMFHEGTVELLRVRMREAFGDEWE